MARRRAAVWLAATLLAPAAGSAQSSAPPALDCEIGFEVLQETAHSLPGASVSEQDGFTVVSVGQPDVWRAQIYFTTRWHPAYPAAAQRTFRKQVTGVWTAESKTCGYGDQGQFTALVTDMKAGDKELTDTSRAEVERQKSSRSPLAPH